MHEIVPPCTILACIPFQVLKRYVFCVLVLLSTLQHPQLFSLSLLEVKRNLARAEIVRWHVIGKNLQPVLFHWILIPVWSHSDVPFYIIQFLSNLVVIYVWHIYFFFLQIEEARLTQWFLIGKLLHTFHLSCFINVLLIYLFEMLLSEVCSVQSGEELCIYTVSRACYYFS